MIPGVGYLVVWTVAVVGGVVLFVVLSAEEIKVLRDVRVVVTEEVGGAVVVVVFSGVVAVGELAMAEVTLSVVAVG